jgi:hypothetical protein
MLFVQTQDISRNAPFEKLEKEMITGAGGEKVRQFSFPKFDWLPEGGKRGWGMSIFAIDKDSAITPHGHYNMVSAHLVLKGKFRVRHFDRIEEQSEHWSSSRRLTESQSPATKLRFPRRKTIFIGSKTRMTENPLRSTSL